VSQIGSIIVGDNQCLGLSQQLVALTLVTALQAFLTAVIKGFGKFFIDTV
jgi:hypothetical protein